jgi:hypothetical protein
VGNEAIRNAPAFRFARLLSCRRLATASNEAPGRWQPPPHPRYPLRFAWLASGLLPRATKRLVGGYRPSHPRFPLLSAGLAGGSLPRQTKLFAGRGFRPHAPAFRFARLLSAGGSLQRATTRLADGSRSHTPAFRFALLGLQVARYRGKRNASQKGAAAPTSPLSASLGLSGRRLATAGNEALRRRDLSPQGPRFPLRSAWLAGGSLPRATKRLADGGCCPYTLPPLSAALGVSCRRLANASNEALGRCLAGGSLPRAAKRLAGGGCRPYTPAFRFARLISCRRLAKAGNGALRRWGCRPTPPHFAALVLSCRRLAMAGNEALAILRAHLCIRIATMTLRR